MTRRAAIREEAQRLKDQKAAERAESQARRAAEREEAARAKAERAYQVAMARAEKAAQRSVRGEDLRIPRGSRASETVEVRQNAEEDLRARGYWRGESTSEGAPLLYRNVHHNLQTSSSFVPLVHATPYHPPLTAQAPHAQFFFTSPSSGLPSLSQFDVSPHSTRPSTQNANQFHVPAIPRQPRNTFLQHDGVQTEEDPATSRCAARPSLARETTDVEPGPRALAERVTDDIRRTLRPTAARDRGTARAGVEPPGSMSLPPW